MSELKRRKRSTDPGRLSGCVHHIGWLARLLPFVLLSGCGCCDCPDPPCPGVASVEIVPPLTYVSGTSVFVLEAWARDRSGNRVACEDTVHWEMPPGLVRPTGGQGSRIRIEVAADAPSGLVTGIRASINGKRSEPARVRIGHSETNADRILVQRTADTIGPAAVILHPEDQSSQCAINNPLAIDDRAVLDENLGPECDGPAFLFASGMAADSIKTAWTDRWDEYDLGAAEPAVTIPLIHYWAGGGTVDMGFIKEQVADANRVFFSNRVGISLPAPQEPTVLTAPSGALRNLELGNINTVAQACEELRPVFKTDTRVKSGEKRLYAIYWSSASAAGAPTTSATADTEAEFNVGGFACPPPGNGENSGIVVIMLEGCRKSMLLAHEVGHLLAMHSPPMPEALAGHSSGPTGSVTGFDKSNLMWAYVSTDMSQTYLALGQVFRMNFDQASWLHYAGLVPGRRVRTCQCDPYERTPCPPLAADFGGTRPTPVGQAEFLCRSQ